MDFQKAGDEESVRTAQVKMMTKFNWSLGPVATASFGLVLVVLVINSVIVHKKTIDLHTSQKKTNATFDVLIRAQSVLASLGEVESNAQSFAMTGDDSFLQAYRQKTIIVQNELRHLQ